MENILEKIYNAGLKFLVPLTLEETYKTIIDEVIKLGDVEYGTIHLKQEGELKRVYASLPLLYKIKPRKTGNTYEALTKRKIIVKPISNLVKVYPQLKKLGIKLSVFIPLSYKNKSIGVLVVSTKRSKEFTKKELNILKLFGSMSTLAIRKAQLYSETIKALETRDLFISMAAHELRTPLTTIHGYVQLLQRKLSNKDSIESRWIEELTWETRRLILLTNELLEANRIKEGQLRYNWKECHLGEVVQRAVANFTFTYPDRKVIIRNKLDSKPDIIIGDFDKLLQVLINILDNAAKFSPINSDIIITLKSRKNFIICCVKDKGKGITATDLPNIFDQFYKRSENAEQGMRLGLYLAKNIIKLHRGSINIRSKINKGTAVEIKLPKAKL